MIGGCSIFRLQEELALTQMIAVQWHQRESARGGGGGGGGEAKGLSIAGPLGHCLYVHRMSEQLGDKASSVATAQGHI